MSEWQGIPIPQLPDFSGFAPPQGNGTYKVAIQAEALGEHEARDSVNLHPGAPAGSTFNRLVSRAGLERDNFAIWNSVWSRPPRNWLEGSPWEGQALAAYVPLRDKAFELYRPRVFVALGNVALKTLTPYGHGKTSISHVQGYVVDGPHDGTWVIGTFHPSALMQGLQGLSGVFMWTLQRAIDIARNGFTREPLDVTTYPSLDEMLAYEHSYNPALWRLDFDIETPESGELEEEDLAEDEESEDATKRDISFNIIRASLCYDGHAISFPWQAPYRDICLRMLGKAQRLGVWNEDFDTPRLLADGAHIGGRVYDFMKLWKHLQPSLPTKLKCRSLEFVAPFYWPSAEPWKHLNNGQPEFYSACDALALNKCGDGIERDLKAKGMWQTCERHVIDTYRVLQQMAANGLPYSKERASAFEAELQQKWDERDLELQSRIPLELKRPKQKTGLVGKPRIGGVTVTLPALTDPDVPEFHFADAVFVKRPFHILNKETMEIGQELRWCQVEPFNPGSPGEDGQVADFVKHYGHSIGTNRKTKKGTVNDEILKKLLRKVAASKRPRDIEFRELLQLVREIRQLKKVLGTYVQGWRPGKDGRIHSTPGFWGRMFRVSWRRPNISATIQDKTADAIARGFRKCVTARAGHLLLEADWKSMEAVLAAYFAGDAEYDRLARLGVHDYLTCHILVDRKKRDASSLPDLSWSDSDLKRHFKEVKQTFSRDRDDAKHCIHGITYGMTSYLMAEMYEMRKADAQRLIDMFFSLFPKIKLWQKSVLDRASKESHLRNPFTYDMQFYEVYKWESRRQIWALGEDAKSAIAFLPRDTGAAMLKEVLLRLEEHHGLASAGIMLASTHDSILCEPAHADVDRVARILHEEMTAAVPELGGLTIPVELKAGESWHDDAMESYELSTPIPALSA